MNSAHCVFTALWLALFPVSMTGQTVQAYVNNKKSPSPLASLFGAKPTYDWTLAVDPKEKIDVATLMMHSTYPEKRLFKSKSLEAGKSLDEIKQSIKEEAFKHQLPWPSQPIFKPTGAGSYQVFASEQSRSRLFTIKPGADGKLEVWGVFRQLRAKTVEVHHQWDASTADWNNIIQTSDFQSKLKDCYTNDNRVATTLDFTSIKSIQDEGEEKGSAYVVDENGIKIAYLSKNENGYQIRAIPPLNGEGWGNIQIPVFDYTGNKNAKRYTVELNLEEIFSKQNNSK